jgi:hypothetical protein
VSGRSSRGWKIMPPQTPFFKKINKILVFYFIFKFF